MKKGRHSRDSMHWRSQRSWKMVPEAEEVVILEEDAGIRGFLEAGGCDEQRRPWGLRSRVRDG